MSKLLAPAKEKKAAKTKIFAYGFDVLGFATLAPQITISDTIVVEFIPFSDDARLDEADGVIIPQGIFEKIEYSDSYAGIHATIQTSTNLLLEREKQTYNLLGENKWVCFLVGKIIDDIPQGDIYSRNINDIDLCKKMLNALGVRRQIVDGLASMETKINEFMPFLRQFGVAKTVFNLPYAEKSTIKTISVCGNNKVGFEYKKQIFFLPFHTTKRDWDTFKAISTMITKAVIDYRQKNIRQIPDWANTFKFLEEERLDTQISKLSDHLIKLDGKLQKWRNYKSILSTSSDILKETIIEILEKFFALKIDPTDEFKEDAKILDEQGNVLILIEIKGVKSGIKREHINQVDSHRERNALTSLIPGVLIINNEMDVDGIEERLKTAVPEEHIQHAQNLNILIIRTIDLLFLIKHLENNPDRKLILLELSISGGGWLKVGSEGYEIVKIS